MVLIKTQKLSPKKDCVEKSENQKPIAPRCSEDPVHIQNPALVPLPIHGQFVVQAFFGIVLITMFAIALFKIIQYGFDAMSCKDYAQVVK